VERCPRGVCTWKWKNGGNARHLAVSERTQYLPTNSRADPLVRGRPPGRPSRARPPVLARLLSQPRSDRVLLDVPYDPVEFPLIANQMVVALFLPERTSREGEHPIRSLGGDPFERFRQLGKRDERCQQQVNVIGHDYKGVLRVMPEGTCVVANSFHYHPGDRGLPEIEGTSTGMLQETIQRGKCPPRANSGICERAIERQTAMETPCNEDWLLGGVNVWQSPIIERHGS